MHTTQGIMLFIMWMDFMFPLLWLVSEHLLDAKFYFVGITIHDLYNCWLGFLVPKADIFLLILMQKKDKKHAMYL